MTWEKERGEERRIKAEFKARRNGYYDRWSQNHGITINDLFLALARKWKRPVREIKRITKT